MWHVERLSCAQFYLDTTTRPRSTRTTCWLKTTMSEIGGDCSCSKSRNCETLAPPSTIQMKRISTKTIPQYVYLCVPSILILVNENIIIGPFLGGWINPDSKAGCCPRVHNWHSCSPRKGTSCHHTWRERERFCSWSSASLDLRKEEWRQYVEWCFT